MKGGVCQGCGKRIIDGRTGIKVKLYVDQVYKLQKVYDSISCLRADLDRINLALLNSYPLPLFTKSISLSSPQVPEVGSLETQSSIPFRFKRVR